MFLAYELGDIHWTFTDIYKMTPTEEVCYNNYIFFVIDSTIMGIITHYATYKLSRNNLHVLGISLSTCSIDR